MDDEDDYLYGVDGKRLFVLKYTVNLFFFSDKSPKAADEGEQENQKEETVRWV